MKNVKENRENPTTKQPEAWSSVCQGLKGFLEHIRNFEEQQIGQSLISYFFAPAAIVDTFYYQEIWW